jgi:hypothetical protein
MIYTISNDAIQGASAIDGRSAADEAFDEPLGAAAAALAASWGTIVFLFFRSSRERLWMN